MLLHKRLHWQCYFSYRYQSEELVGGTELENCFENSVYFLRRFLSDTYQEGSSEWRAQKKILLDKCQTKSFEGNEHSTQSNSHVSMCDDVNQFLPILYQRTNYGLTFQLKYAKRLSNECCNRIVELTSLAS